MRNNILSRSLLGDAITSAASPLLSPGEHFRCSSPGRSPVTPRRPYDSSKEDGYNLAFAKVDTREAPQPTRWIGSPMARRMPSRSTVKIGPAPRRFRKPTMPAPLQDTGPMILIGDSSPTEVDKFLPGVGGVITPSLLPQIKDEHKFGTFTAVNIILGKTIGVGVYSVPSSVFVDVGSVGATIVLWLLGSFISFCGMAVYLDLGSALPRSGGERIYLERIFRHPRMLATFMFMAYAVLLGFSTPNCIVLGEYMVYALGLEPKTWMIRTIAVLAITIACGMHACFPRVGLYTINILGIAKMIILAFVIFSGLAASIISFPSLTTSSSQDGTGQLQTTAQRNFSNIWAGSSSSPYNYSTALLKILYCFRGYNTANTVLSSVRRPIPTLKLAAPLALSIVSASYLFANLAYFCAVEKEDFREAGVVLAGRFLTNLFGETIGERVLPWLVIISAFGNVAATSFAQAAVNQELGRDGLLPYADFWAGKRWIWSPALFTLSSPTTASPTSSPSTSIKIGSYRAIRTYPYKSTHEKRDSMGPALFLHFLVSVLVILLPPPGQIYTFLVEIGGYPVNVIGVAVAGGLLYLQLNKYERWNSPIPANKICIGIFLLSNLVVCILPWINPNPNGEQQEKQQQKQSGDGERFPYYAYPATGLGILLSGAYYWVWWRYLKPIVFPPKKPMLGFGNGFGMRATGTVGTSGIGAGAGSRSDQAMDQSRCDIHGPRSKAAQGADGTVGSEKRHLLDEEVLDHLDDVVDDDLAHE